MCGRAPVASTTVSPSAVLRSLGRHARAQPELDPQGSERPHHVLAIGGQVAQVQRRQARYLPEQAARGRCLFPQGDLVTPAGEAPRHFQPRNACPDDVHAPGHPRAGGRRALLHLAAECGINGTAEGAPAEHGLGQTDITADAAIDGVPLVVRGLQREVRVGQQLAPDPQQVDRAVFHHLQRDGWVNNT